MCVELHAQALDLGRGESDMVEEIWQELAKAKYLEWEAASDSRMWKFRTLKYVCTLFVK